MESVRKHHISFKNAINGIVWSFNTQPNFKVHAFFSLSALISGIVFRISFIEFVIIIFAIILGISAEMVNTSIESMSDLITSEWRKEAKIAKDVSAGMMLITALGAVIIASFIFIPKILILVPGLY